MLVRGVSRLIVRSHRSRSGAATTRAGGAVVVIGSTRRAAWSRLSQRNYSTAREELIQHLQDTIAEERAPNDESSELESLLRSNDWKIKLDSTVGGAVLTRFSSEGDEITVRILADEEAAAAAHEDNADEDAAHHDNHSHAHEESLSSTEDNPMAGQNDAFEISVRRSSQRDRALKFDCVAKDGVIFIRRIGVTPAQGGPAVAVMNFEELPEQTQTILENYLMERSINQDFARIVFLSLNRYDSHQFVNWMEHVNKFLQ